MSQPKYMTQKHDSTMSIVVKAESLVSYLYRITANEKQFPKAYRYTLISKILNESLDLLMDVYNGCSKRAITVEDYAVVREFQKSAYKHLISIKGLLVVSQNIAHISNPKYLAELFDDTVDSFNHWVKNTKRSERKAIWKQGLTEDEKYDFKMKAMSKKAKRMKHDEDGFIVLIPRDSK